MAAPGLSVDPSATLRDAATVGLLLAARLSPLGLLGPYLARVGSAGLLGSLCTLALTLALWPLALEGTAGGLPTDAFAVTTALLRELIRGAVLSLSLLAPLVAMRFAGALSDQLLQPEPGQLSAHVEAPPTGPLATLYLFAAALLLVSMDGHLLLIERLGGDLLRSPPGTGVGPLPSAADLGRVGGDALSLALLLSAPAWVAVLVVELGMGLLARLRRGPGLGLQLPIRRLVLIGAVMLGLPMLLGRLPEAIGRALSP